MGFLATAPLDNGESSVGLMVGTIIGAVKRGISVDDAGGNRMTPLVGAGSNRSAPDSGF
jgi:hypothetical protein